jgi:hypothetical protein
MKSYTKKELSLMSHAAAKKYAILQGIPRTTKKIRPLNPPQCSTKGCNKSRAETNWHWVAGTPVYRLVCTGCHGKRIAERNGFDKFSQFLNTKHPYRKHRKDYCENKDGRLGYKCTNKIRISAQLEVDHKNGNPHDNRLRNLQTLCCMCHTYKTHVKRDYATPGRKTLAGK